jgi:aminoglycoside 6-adenylyltransferase
MRNEQQMLKLILSTARQDERIRAVCLEGSRTNPKAPRDIFQDYDVVYVVGETASFQQDNGWIDRFGERLYMQYPEDHPVYPSDREHCYGWLIQFADGNRLDLHVSTADWVLEHDAKDSLFTVLLDKDGLFAGREPADDSAFGRDGTERCPQPSDSVGIANGTRATLSARLWECPKESRAVS